MARIVETKFGKVHSIPVPSRRSRTFGYSACPRRLLSDVYRSGAIHEAGFERAGVPTRTRWSASALEISQGSPDPRYRVPRLVSPQRIENSSAV
jgi:hypothetical protein